MSYKSNVCLKTIAYELDISINTVSRALRDCSDISEKTKKRVRQKALEMGYLPNNLLHSMKEGNSKLIALVINNIYNYYFMIMSEKIIYYLKKEGYLCVIISLYGNEFTSETVKECIYQRVDGIVSFVEPTKESLDFVKLNQIPFLMLGRKINDKYCDMIYTDDIEGGKKAAEYLVNKGCKNFLYINVNGSECSQRRYQGFKDYLKLEVKTTKYKKVDIENFRLFILDNKNLENLGIFCYNDEHAFIVMDTLNSVGVDINKVNIIGYDAVSSNIKGTIKVPSIGFDYNLIAKTASYCITTPFREREKVCMCFDTKLIELGEKNEIQ